MEGRRQHGEGSVYQRSRDDMWVAVSDLGWRSGRRDRKEFTSRDLQVALDRRARYEDRRRDGFVMPKGRQPYVSEWMLHWLHNIAKGNVEAGTWNKSYRQKVTDLICPYFERIPLPELDEEGVENWQRDLRRRVSERTGQPLSPTTILQTHRIFSMAINVAVVRKRIIRNPLLNVRAPAAAEYEAIPPTDDEILAVLEECTARRTGARWITSMATGLRQGEALGILWPHLSLDDPEDLSLAVEWELIRLPIEHGCGDAHACGDRLHRYPCADPCQRYRPSGKQHVCIRDDDPKLCAPDCEQHARSCPQRTGGLQLKRPKSRRSRATIPVAPFAAAALRQLRTAQAAERLAFGEGYGAGWVHDPEKCAGRIRPRQLVCTRCMLPVRPGLLVFSGPDGAPVGHRADWQDWSDIQEAAGIEHHRVHDSRHGVATMLLEEGMDIRVVQEIMRHSTPEITRKLYMHVRQKVRRDAADAIERRLGGLRSVPG